MTEQAVARRKKRQDIRVLTGKTATHNEGAVLLQPHLGNRVNQASERSLSRGSAASYDPAG